MAIFFCYCCKIEQVWGPVWYFRNEFQQLLRKILIIHLEAWAYFWSTTCCQNVCSVNTFGFGSFFFFLFYCFALWHLRLSDLRYYSFDGTISSSLRAINVICAGRLLVRFKFVKQPLLKLTDYHNASCTVYKHPSILWMHNWDYQTVRPA